MLFSKEKGVIFSLFNGVLVIWIISAFLIAVSNITMIVVKDYEYTKEEYKLLYCNIDYETEEECESNYIAYKLDNKNINVEYKRNIINSLANVIIISSILFIVNKKRKNS